MPRLLILFIAAFPAFAQPPRTLRLDFFHAGTAAAESFSLDSLVLEGPWSGRADRSIDDSNLGKYLFEVSDAKSGRLLFSRGFASIYGEWETTGEAKSVRRTFHESLRFPAPGVPANVTIRKRDDAGPFREVWSVTVDPADRTIDRAPAPRYNVWSVIQSGPPQNKVDVLLLGDGYTAAEMPKWRKDARRFAETLLSYAPFKENRSRFNVWAIDTPADESGISRPSENVWRRSPLRASYDALGSERYVLALDNKRIREIASAVPYDFLGIVVNGRKYGGGGIHQLYATVASDNAFSNYILVHEFGHHFAALADEYYTSDVAYLPPEKPIEPWEPNVTVDPKAGKWGALLSPGVPLPTPWPKEAFEESQKKTQARRREIRAKNLPEAEMEVLFRAELAETEKLLSSHPHGRAVGAFEGANYQVRGYYRPQSDCIMFTRTTAGFCAVCRRALQRVIEQYSTP